MNQPKEIQLNLQAQHHQHQSPHIHQEVTIPVNVSGGVTMTTLATLSPIKISDMAELPMSLQGKQREGNITIVSTQTGTTTEEIEDSKAGVVLGRTIGGRYVRL